MENNVTKKWNEVEGRNNEWLCILPSGIRACIWASRRGWFLHCPRLQIHQHKLWVKSFEAAKEAAEKYMARCMRQKIDTMQYDVDALVGPRKTFLVGFNNGDETEFDADDYAELMECLVVFFAENGIKNPRINYINMSEYEEEKADEVVLTDADRARISRLNARNGYEITASILKRLCQKHRLARRSGCALEMARIEYRLTDINFHHECSLLHYGEYAKFNAELKNF